MTYWPGGGGSGLTIGTTTVSSATNRGILYSNTGILRDSSIFVFNTGGELQVGSSTDKGSYVFQSTGNFIHQAATGGYAFRMASPNGGTYYDYYLDNGLLIWNASTDNIFRHANNNVANYTASMWTINPGASNYDFKVRGQTTDNLFYVEAGSSGEGVGIGTNTPNASSILDITSTTKGVLFPRMTTTQKNAISSPVAGLVVFDTTLGKLCVYTTAWETITSL